MATITATKDLDVIDKYKELIDATLDGDSLYIRTKETLEELFVKGGLKDTDKAKVIAEVMSSLNTSVVQSSMTAALTWSSQEKDIELKKLELAKQLDILDNEILIKAKTYEKLSIDNITAQSERLRLYGQATTHNGVVVNLSEEGKLYYETELTKQNSYKAASEKRLMDSKVKESQATVHKIVADAYVNYGNFSYTLSDSGLTSITDGTPTSYVTLSELQAQIAREQAKGYAYNAWANAATGVASTIGVAITSEVDIFDKGETGYVLVENLITATNNLKNIQAPSL